MPCCLVFHWCAFFLTSQFEIIYIGEAKAICILLIRGDEIAKIKKKGGEIVNISTDEFDRNISFMISYTTTEREVAVLYIG